MDFANIKALIIPEGEVIKITGGGATIWEKVVAPSYKNWVKHSTEADGKTIYNGGLGYKNGYRVRSGGAEAESVDSTITGYIPFVKGDKLYIYPPFTGRNTQNAINFADASFANLGQVTDSGAAYGICVVNGVVVGKTEVVNGVSVLDITNVTAAGFEKVAYVRITNRIQYYDTDNALISSGAEMIVTVNEEIE